MSTSKVFENRYQMTPDEIKALNAQVKGQGHRTLKNMVRGILSTSVFAASLTIGGLAGKDKITQLVNDFGQPITIDADNDLYSGRRVPAYYYTINPYNTEDGMTMIGKCSVNEDTGAMDVVNAKGEPIFTLLPSDMGNAGLIINNALEIPESITQYLGVNPYADNNPDEVGNQNALLINSVAADGLREACEQ